MWRIIDTDDKGYINSFQINYFFREIMDNVPADDKTAVEDVRDEIFDMISPKDPLKYVKQLYPGLLLMI